LFKLEFTVTKARWLDDPNLRWRAGAEAAGVQFRQRLQRENYPPPPPMSTYVRTGTLANKANFAVYEVGGSVIVFFGSTFYLPHLLYITPNWSGKLPELLDYMQSGFIQGVRDYKE
jgi:hypothetical protein